MSIAVMSRVWAYSEAKGGELLVLLALADSANDKGEAWISVVTIAKKARMKERNARYVLRTLELTGQIEDLGTHTDPRFRGVSVYRVLPITKPMDGGKNCPPSEGQYLPPRGATQCPPGGQNPAARGATQCPQSKRNPEREEEESATSTSPASPLTGEPGAKPRGWRAAEIIRKYGGVTESDGHDIVLTEWKREMLGLSLAQVVTVFRSAQRAVPWPSDFRALRKAWEVHGRPPAPVATVPAADSPPDYRSRAAGDD